MIRIQVLGTGCPRCKSLLTNVTVALESLGLQAELEKVEDLDQIMTFGVRALPALVVDGKVVVTGQVASVQQLKSLLGPGDLSPLESVRPGPSKTRLATALLVLGLSIGLVIHAKGQKGAEGVPAATQTVASEGPLPSMIEVGAGKCAPCIAMQPVLEELRKDYEGKLRVEYVDFFKDQARAETFQVGVIPTQIFLDHQGKEVFRHTGFYAKLDIDAKLKELRVLR